MSENDFLRLLEQAYPGRAQADLLAMIEATPDARAAKAAEKPVQRRVGSRPKRRQHRATSVLGLLWPIATKVGGPVHPGRARCPRRRSRGGPEARGLHSHQQLWLGSAIRPSAMPCGRQRRLASSGSMYGE